MRLLPSLALLAMPFSAQASLIAWYPFNEGSGGVANDASGHGNTLNGNGTWLPTGAFGGSIQLGPSSSFSARTGSVGSLTGINATVGNKVSVSFWMKANAESAGSSVFYMNDSATGSGNRLLNAHMEWTDGTTYWDAGWPAPGAGPRISGNMGLVSDALHHYVMTYDGDTGAMAVIRDGVSVISGTSTLTAALGWSGVRNFEIGALSFQSFWPGGQIDDFAIFNTVLTASEINIVRTQGVGALVPEPGTATLALLSLGGLCLSRRRR